MIIKNCRFEYDACKTRYVCVECARSYKPPRLCYAPAQCNCVSEVKSRSVLGCNIGRTYTTGDVLHCIIKRFTREEISTSCQCKSRIKQMNVWGPTGCREHIDEIVEWLSEEATKRGWRMAKWRTGRLGIRLMVLYAIRKAERAHRR